jgi:DNA-binding PucR family transcriptional regulator
MTEQIARHGGADELVPVLVVRLPAILHEVRDVLADEPASHRLAELALRLRHEHVLDGDPVFVDHHLDAMIVHRDRPLLAAVRRQCLGPLYDLPSATRDRLSTTLGSWLLHMGDRRAVAAELHVHPQTVRYRLTQLRELFGPALDDPASRRTLLLALAWGGDDETGTPDG